MLPEPPETSETGEVYEVWVYAGIRIVDGQVAQAWITDAGKGESVYFPPRGKPVIGAAYRACVTRRAGRVLLNDQPLHLPGNGIPPDARAKLIAENEVARNHLAAARLERAATIGDDLKMLLQPLKNIAKNMRRRSDREAFLAHIIHELISPDD